MNLSDELFAFFFPRQLFLFPQGVKASYDTCPRFPYDGDLLETLAPHEYMPNGMRESFDKLDIREIFKGSENIFDTALSLVIHDIKSVRHKTLERLEKRGRIYQNLRDRKTGDVIGGIAAVSPSCIGVSFNQSVYRVFSQHPELYESFVRHINVLETIMSLKSIKPLNESNPNSLLLPIFLIHYLCTRRPESDLMDMDLASSYLDLYPLYGRLEKKKKYHRAYTIAGIAAGYGIPLPDRYILSLSSALDETVHWKYEYGMEFPTPITTTAGKYVALLMASIREYIVLRSSDSHNTPPRHIFDPVILSRISCAIQHMADGSIKQDRLARMLLSNTFLVMPIVTNYSPETNSIQGKKYIPVAAEIFTLFHTFCRQSLGKIWVMAPKGEGEVGVKRALRNLRIGKGEWGKGLFEAPPSQVVKTLRHTFGDTSDFAGQVELGTVLALMCRQVYHNHELLSYRGKASGVSNPLSVFEAAFRKSRSFAAAFDRKMWSDFFPEGRWLAAEISWTAPANDTNKYLSVKDLTGSPYRDEVARSRENLCNENIQNTINKYFPEANPYITHFRPEDFLPPEENLNGEHLMEHTIGEIGRFAPPEVLANPRIFRHKEGDIYIIENWFTNATIVDQRFIKFLTPGSPETETDADCQEYLSSIFNDLQKNPVEGYPIHDALMYRSVCSLVGTYLHGYSIGADNDKAPLALTKENFDIMTRPLTTSGKVRLLDGVLSFLCYKASDISDGSVIPIAEILKWIAQSPIYWDVPVWPIGEHIDDFVDKYSARNIKNGQGVYPDRIVVFDKFLDILVLMALKNSDYKMLGEKLSQNVHPRIVSSFTQTDPKYRDTFMRICYGTKTRERGMERIMPGLREQLILSETIERVSPQIEDLWI